jgi:hypothetical protein
MSPVSHQTIKLSKGRHSSPRDGACVMELASMLAGESFSDHPAAACPVIGSFLRAYNDLIDDRRRQDLYAYAAEVVGSRAARAVEDARAARLVQWAGELSESSRRRWWWGRRAHRGPSTNEAAGPHAVHAITRHTRRTHGAVLALLDELLAMGRIEPGEAEAQASRLEAGASA